MPLPTHEPSDEGRAMVKSMAGYGVPQDDIATVLDIDPKTLRKHYSREIALGMAQANARVGQSLFTQATSGNNVAAAIFWMKSRAGWREKNSLELTGENGAPLIPSLSVTIKNE